MAVVVTGSLMSCGTRTPGVGGSQLTIPDLQAITEAIASAAQYPASKIEITSSSVRFHLSIRDAQLAAADEGARTAAATALVAASEQALASHPEFSTLEAISISIIHHDDSVAGGKNWHIEDVIEFRRGPSGRFFLHVT